ncbi:MAG: bifunctional precorrin-2 dehydrogenase/sirohydrochlorin ferrochelatase [Polyangiaceae bacterium]|nr:bifunctional precorrin-2 dehydrogenase/sirohydrochlorin ferrochelatase [Polyangiaceae bacterium]
MNLQPAMLDLRGAKVLVVGSDADALQRVHKLLEAGARVHMLVNDAKSAAELLSIESERVHIEQRSAVPEDIDGCMLTIVSTLEEAQAPPLFERAKAHGRLLCTVDRPEFSTFIHPAVMRAGHLAISVSTQGASPSLARRIREDLEEAFSDPRFVPWLNALAETREALPRGERATFGNASVRGFSMEIALTFPPKHA